MEDQYGREINYLRISITSDCNLHCCYCMPNTASACSCMQKMSEQELIQIVTVMAKLGIRYVKITGGEPLLHHDCASLVARVKRIPGIERVTLTTNGILLKQQLSALLDAGLDAVNISLDAVEPELFSRITGGGRLSAVLDGLEAAVAAGLQTKINAVLMRKVNENQWEKLVLLAKDHPIDVRFIEMMPIGLGGRFDSLSSQEILQKMRESGLELTPDDCQHGFGPAEYYRIQGYQGSVGLIHAIHGKFCSTCNRVRLAASGWLRLCLCYDSGVNVRQILQTQPKQMEEILRQTIYKKPKEHCFECGNEQGNLLGMYMIGG